MANQIPQKLGERFAKLLAAVKDLHAKQADILDEIDDLLGGKASIGEKLKAFETAFDAAWCSRYAAGETGRYLWNYAQDRPHTKRFLKSIPLEDLEERALRYIRSEDRFYTEHRHPFSLFVRSINQWAAEAPAPDTPGDGFDLTSPSDCKHTPRCKTDAEHTRRRGADMRAVQ